MKKSPPELLQRRYETIYQRIVEEKCQHGARVARSRELLGKRFFTTDVHSHSNYSDGQSTPAENAEFARMGAIDMIFATDHSCMKQKREAVREPNMSWGEENGVVFDEDDKTFAYHMGMLRGPKVYKVPREGKLPDIIAKTRKHCEFLWLAHPVGFEDLSDDTIQSAAEHFASIGNIAVEVLNAFHDMRWRAFYRTGQAGMVAVDRALRMGGKVTLLGVSDAHCGVEIGNAWTGVYAKDGKPESITKAMNAGRTFASEASALHFSCNRRPMGSTVRPQKGSELKFGIRAADALGLDNVRLICNGKVIREIDAQGEQVIEEVVVRKVPRSPSYFRLESRAADDRRAYASPVYVIPGR